ncbi:MAG: neutral/alkaline non-lysosomal ceramidase N-terminal domain-containing protein [Proteobacteria bacterium]|nr:neutral/alkaline non-lysosomal ceramidase N-terminal domain-containing protein [Pseudomonadota bacterium]
MATELRAGVGRAELQPVLGIPMMGYGARRGTANARHDPLFVRALHLEAGEAALLVECDLCLMAVSQAAAVRRRIGERTGLSPDRILVGCTHTHSGPDTGLGSLLAGGEPPAFVQPLLDAAVEAGVAAVKSSAPAALAAGRAEAHIGRNRRSADGSAHPGAIVLRVDTRGGGPLAVLYVHGCHPTALGHDNLAYSADWPGAASRAIEDALPGSGVTAIFALGAHADVDPRTRGLLDLAIPDQSIGVGPDEMEALGREVGEAVAKTAASLRPERDVRIDARARRIRLQPHPGAADPEDRERLLARRRSEALAALGLPADSELRTADFYRLEGERVRDLPDDETRERRARVRLYLRDRTARRIAGGEEPEVEVQILRLGPVLLLGLPIEVCVDVGLEWRRRSRVPLASVVSIANGWLRYLPHHSHFAEPRADQRYEILQSTFVPSSAGRLLEAGLDLAREVS